MKRSRSKTSTAIWRHLRPVSTIPFRCRSSVAVSPFCRCKIPFRSSRKQKKRQATPTASATVYGNGNGEMATEERQRNDGNRALPTAIRSSARCSGADCMQARNQGGRSGRMTPRLSAKGPLLQVKESIPACNKIKISFCLTQSLLPNEVADSVRFRI